MCPKSYIAQERKNAKKRVSKLSKPYHHILALLICKKGGGEIKTIAFNNFQSHTRNVLNVIIGVGFSSYYTGSLFINADISLKSAVVICMRKWVLE